MGHYFNVSLEGHMRQVLLYLCFNILYKKNYNNIIQENYDLDTNNRIDKILGIVMDFF